MAMPSLPFSAPGELEPVPSPLLLYGLVITAITILTLTFIYQYSISSSFQFLAKTQFVWPWPLLDSPSHPTSNTSSSSSLHSLPPDDDDEGGEELGVVVQCKAPMEDPSAEEVVECAVCLCNIEEGEEMRELRCEHHFHRACLDRWVAYRHVTCPICRETLLAREIARKVIGWREGDELEGLMSEYSSFLGSHASNSSSTRIQDSSLSLY